MTPKYYVYELINPITQQVFYVGKGTHKRFKVHYSRVKNGRIANDRNYNLTNVIKDIINKGLEPVYNFPITTDDELEAYAWEAAHIDYYGMDNLCNGCPGGEVYNPMKDNHHTNEHKDMMKQLHKDPGLQRRNYVGTIKGRYGSVANYFEQRYIKQSKEDKKILNKNLKLLDSVMCDIRRKLLSTHNRIKQRLIDNGVVIDNINKLYTRICSNCGHTIKHNSEGSMMCCIRRGHNCNRFECRKSLGKTQCQNDV